MDKMVYCAGTETHCPKIHFSGGHYSRCMDSLWADVTPNKMPAAFVCSSAASFPKPAQRPGEPKLRFISVLYQNIVHCKYLNAITL